MFPFLNPPPSPYHPSGSSQCTSPKHPVSCIEPGLATRFIHDTLHVSMPFSQIVPPSPSPTESLRLFYKFLSLDHCTCDSQILILYFHFHPVQCFVLFFIFLETSSFTNRFSESMLFHLWRFCCYCFPVWLHCGRRTYSDFSILNLLRFLWWLRIWTISKYDQ